MSDSPNPARRPSEVVPENQFSIGDDEEETGTRASASQGGLRLPMPERPAMHTINSSTGLLSGDASDAGTPFTPFVDDPFNRNSGILDNGSLAPNSEPSSPINGPQHLNEPVGPPKIHLNSGSIPNTPERPSASTFEAAPSFSSPFASSHDMPSATQLTNRRRSSVAPSQQAASNYGATDDEDTKKRMSTSAASGRLATITGGLSSGVTSKATSNIINRRSQRAKANRLSKKDRDSKDYKGTGSGLKRAPFQSTRLKGEIYKPWMEKRDPAMRWARWITIASIIIGFALAAFLCYNGYAAVPNLGKVCERLNDDFNTLDTNTWQREVRLDGYGHGSFQWTTNDDKNSFVEDGILYLVPTLTSDVIGEDAVTNGYTLNLTTDGTCTSTNVSQCVAVSNSSRLTVINPVRSARLITKNTVTLNYGKVEVKAKFPTGDWLWPSISLLPVNNTYGEWPRSGQIDIVTGRGNNNTYPNRGVDYAQSSLHWGPTTDLDRLWMTWGYREQRRTYYNQQWHTYGLEWNDKYMWTYIDSKVSQVISLRFNKQSFWERGKFPSTITNSTTGDVIKLINPWLSSENNVAPFDQPFYLVLDLSVGATDGWFPDGEGGKPWLDNSGTSMSDFWLSKDKWWNQWSTDPKERGFAIDSVKMWEVC